MAVALGAKSGLDFSDMQAVQVGYQKLIIYYGTSVRWSNGSTFWSNLDLVGAYTSDGSTTANQYYTQVNITGRGYLGNIITPCLGTGTATLTTKVTIDGKAIERTIDMYGTPNTHRLIFGPPGHLAAEGIQNYGYTMGGYSGYGFHNTGGNDNFHNHSGNFGVLSTGAMLGMGLPVIPFYHSLKVEIKQSATGWATNANLYHYGGVGYIRTD